MTQYQADAYCQSQNTRLPTARELVMNSLANYPENLRTDRISDPSGENCCENYYLIETIETTGGLPNGQTDHFCFNPTGYIRPVGVLENNSFWSSSVLNRAYYSPYSHLNRTHYSQKSSAFYQLGANGAIYDNSRDIYYAVRCVLSPLEKDDSLIGGCFQSYKYSRGKFSEFTWWS